MSLSEGKMFTIEALNRIEGFVWPDDMKCAAMIKDGICVWFCQELVSTASEFLSINGWVTNKRVESAHPDWRNSLITREEFDSVNGWVRNDGNEPVISGDFDLLLADGEAIYFSDISVDRWDWAVPCKGGVAITHWRYHKPQKQEVKPDPESIETMIRRYKDAKENKRAAIDKLNQSQADVEQAEALEDSLFMAIEAWAESHGFDIRVLSESEEKPELVITDWRDLQVGDVVIYQDGLVSDLIGLECEVEKLDWLNDELNVGVFNKEHIQSAWPSKWKFIRRPEEK